MFCRYTCIHWINTHGCMDAARSLQQEMTRVSYIGMQYKGQSKKIHVANNYIANLYSD